jgi:hypothetical protein
MYAVVLDNKVLGPAVLNKKELSRLKKNNPKYLFVEMTKKNSPMEIGDIYNG